MPASGPFSVGDWTVEPDLDRLSRGDERVLLRPQVMRLLVYLAERQGEVVRSDDLMGDLWSGKIVSDAALYNCVAELRNVLDRDGEGESAIQTVPKKGYRLRLPVSGIGTSDTKRTKNYKPTNDGTSLEKDAAANDSIAHFSGRHLNFIVISLLCAALAVFAYDKWWLAEPAEASIAVLPFKNLSADPDQEYFAEGIAEEILDVLARTPGLSVIASRSSFQFEGEHHDIKDIGRALDVALILDGSVRYENGTVRVVAQLVDAEAGTHLWSQSYDREFKDVLSLQNELSRAVVSAVSERLGLSTTNDLTLSSVEVPEAYAAYMRGKHAKRLQTEAGLRRAIEQFEKAIDLQPGYAEAHAELAVARLSKISTQEARDSDGANLAAAVRHAKLALAMEPGLPAGHFAMAGIVWLDGRFDEAIQHLERAIKANPNYARAHFLLGSLVGSFFQGRYAEGRALWKRATDLDPVGAGGYWNETNILLMRREWDKALEQIDKLESISPARAAYKRGAVPVLIDGKWASGAIGALNALRIEPSENWMWRLLADHLARLGLETEVRSIPVPVGVSPFHILGRTHEAATIAEAIVEKNEDSAGVPVYSLKHDLRILGRALAAAGNFEKARPLLEEMWELSEHRVTIDGPFRMYDALALISIRRQADEEEATDELITALYDDVRRLRKASMFGGRFLKEGLAAYFDGQRQMGLELIAEAVEQNMYIWPNEAYLKDLYDDPGFGPIRKMQEERQARERERFLAIVCNENPWADIWQPSEETCGQFYAAADQ
ncbi:winged helix-turn-helix domain-containing tetratricopeptide repeat protein [Lentisalinibacter salinarum]|uniref:winged helix-turn-helix domain-containing tetratricopeptide repeat protein n=1 Tax=Lentisalinibacter salinarum TaxID=2992239 RepID=UPI00386B88BB